MCASKSSNSYSLKSQVSSLYSLLSSNFIESQDFLYVKD